MVTLAGTTNFSVVNTSGSHNSPCQDNFSLASKVKTRKLTLTKVSTEISTVNTAVNRIKLHFFTERYFSWKKAYLDEILMFVTKGSGKW